MSTSENDSLRFFGLSNVDVDQSYLTSVHQSTEMPSENCILNEIRYHPIPCVFIEALRSDMILG